MKNISCCGSDCGGCQYHGGLCGGCNETQGKPFFSLDKPCAIYQCAVLEKGRHNCAGCDKLPCGIWQDTRDPKFTDEEFAENICQRIERLNGNIKFGCAVIAVKDVEVSKKFYGELLDQHVVADLGWNVTLSGGFALQQEFDWLCGIPKETMRKRSHNMELYFEVKDFEGFLKKLEAYPDIQYVHPVKKHEWQQRVVRIYDPDGHIIEIGESMAVIAKRYLAEGLSPEETAKRIQHPIQFVNAVQSGLIS